LVRTLLGEEGELDVAAMTTAFQVVHLQVSSASECELGKVGSAGDELT
jgi:hypothetical protein